VLSLLGAVIVAVGGAVAAAEVPPSVLPAGEPVEPTVGAPLVEHRQSLLLDPSEFFALLVERYRGLVAYADQVRLIQTIEKAGDEPYQTDRRLICQIDDDGNLRVQTAARQARGALGLTIPLKEETALREMRRRYDLWLMPHMVLKYADQPLREFREGVADGFTATEAAAVTVDEKPMVQVTLRAGDEQTAAEAEFDLFVNPDSMLIERIVGAQRLPDGASLETTLEITPVAASERPAAPPPAAPPSEPLPAVPGAAPPVGTAAPPPLPGRPDIPSGAVRPPG
jgi:hypothetical protein